MRRSASITCCWTRVSMMESGLSSIWLSPRCDSIRTARRSGRRSPTARWTRSALTTPSRAINPSRRTPATSEASPTGCRASRSDFRCFFRKGYAARFPSRAWPSCWQPVPRRSSDCSRAKARSCRAPTPTWWCGIPAHGPGCGRQYSMMTSARHRTKATLSAAPSAPSSRADGCWPRMTRWSGRPPRVARYPNPLPAGPAAIDRHDAAGHVDRLRGEEEGDERGDILGPAGVAEEDAALDSRSLPRPGVRLGRVGGEHRRADRTGADAIDADSLVRVVDRHGARQPDDAGLGRAVGRAIGATNEAVLRADIDDRAAARPAQEGNDG